MSVTDILYISKQRLMAMEELKKLQDENNLLLEEIEVLETEIMQGAVLVANIFRLSNYMDDNVKFHLQQSYIC